MHSTLVVIPFFEHILVKALFCKDTILIVILIEEDLQEPDPWQVLETHAPHVTTKLNRKLSCCILSDSIVPMPPDITFIFIVRLFTDKRQTNWMIILINFCHFIGNSFGPFIDELFLLGKANCIFVFKFNLNIVLITVTIFLKTNSFLLYLFRSNEPINTNFLTFVKFKLALVESRLLFIVTFVFRVLKYHILNMVLKNLFV